MFKTLANAWKVKELRDKILFTLMIILVYRIGAVVTVPFVDAESITSVVNSTLGGMASLLSTLSSGFEQASLFALGVSPYITASIVIQLLTVAIPSLERLAKQGEEGKKKITVITRYITMGIALITAIGYYFMIQRVVTYTSSTFEQWLMAIVIIVCFCAGSALVMWLAERINEKGIGNGISIILFANIVSRGISIVREFYAKMVAIVHGNPYGISSADVADVKSQYESYHNMFWKDGALTSTGEFFDQYNLKDVHAYEEPFSEAYKYLEVGSGWAYRIPAILVLLLTTIGVIALIWFVVHISDSERRIPVQYAKKVVGRKMYGGRNTNLPLKVNMAGVMPVIFASAILSLPAMIIGFCSPEKGSFWYGVYEFLSPNTWFYALMTFVLLLAFAYFYVSISFNPFEVANNLQQNGGSVPGIRPGKPTALYIKKVLSRVTFIGALCLSVVAVVPVVVYVILNAVGGWTDLPGLMGSSMISDFVNSGTSIIIVVGVVLEVVRELESQMTMRHYKGFLD